MKRFVEMMLLSILLLAVPFIASAAEVKNIRQSQVGDKAVATYDLVGSGGEQDAKVTVAIIVNGERKTSDQLSITGDFGKNVRVGNGKKIIWNATKDLPADFEGDINWDIKTATQAVENANPGISSLQAQMDLDNLTKMLDENNYSHEKRIQYYKAFIKDYRGTDAAKEAADLIAQEQRKAEEEGRQAKEQQQRLENAKRQGYIDDPDAGLQWAPGPDRDTTWDQANSYAQNLTIAGGGWRLPTRAELKSLYSRLSSFGGKNVFLNSGWWVWSSELDASNPSLAWDVSLVSGDGRWDVRTFSYHTRVLAVRSRR